MNKIEPMISYEHGKIVIAFRGTKEGADWLTNLDGIRGASGSFYGVSGNVHAGFHNRFLEIKEKLCFAVENLRLEFGYSTCEILITDHSLGGALASLTAAYLKSISRCPHVRLITFSSPRVFNTESAQDVENIIGKDNILRIWREGDIVPHAALNILGYKHIGHSIKLTPKRTSMIGFDRENHKHDHMLEDACGLHGVIIPEIMVS